MIKQGGQTLIEVVVALAAAVVVVSSITVAVLTALTNAEYSRAENQATSFAQQGMELIRSMRNSNFSNFVAIANTNTYCMAKSCTSLSLTANNNASQSCGPEAQNCGPQNLDTFVREVTIDQGKTECGTATYKVTVSVSWADNKCTSTSNLFCHKVSIVSCFSNYGIIPTP